MVANPLISIRDQMDRNILTGERALSLFSPVQGSRKQNVFDQAQEAQRIKEADEDDDLLAWPLRPRITQARDSTHFFLNYFMARTKQLPAYIRDAIKSGHVPKIRDWRNLPIKDLTLGEKTCRFAEKFITVGEGDAQGSALHLADYQVAFILSLIDSPVHTRMGILSVGRRNGKTFVTAALALAALCGPLTHPNSLIASAALSREQSALVFRAIQQFIQASPKLQAILRVVPSSKRIHNLIRS